METKFLAEQKRTIVYKSHYGIVSRFSVKIPETIAINDEKGLHLIYKKDGKFYYPWLFNICNSFCYLPIVCLNQYPHSVDGCIDVLWNSYFSESGTCSNWFSLYCNLVPKDKVPRGATKFGDEFLDLPKKSILDVPKFFIESDYDKNVELFSPGFLIKERFILESYGIN